jgi:hypothetical protein
MVSNCTVSVSPAGADVMRRKLTAIVLASALALALVPALARRARANFVVSFPSSPVTIQAGSTATTQFTVTIAGPDSLFQTNLIFLITRDPTNPIPPVAYPSFVTPTTATDPTFNDPLYVFNNGNSLFAGSGPFGHASNPGTGFNTKFAGGDVALNAVPITSLNNHLADLLINSTVSGVTNAGGDLYDITLDPSSFLNDANGAHIPFSVNAGQIKVVTNAAAVPEPASLGLGLSALALLSSCWLWHRARDGGRSDRSPRHGG